MIELGAGTLSCEQIRAIARDREQVRLAPGVHARLTDGHRVDGGAGRAAPGLRPVDRCRVAAGPTASPTPELNLGTRPAARAMRPPPARRCRPPRSGRWRRSGWNRSRPAAAGSARRTADALVDLLNADRMPAVGRFNSLGTGDVAPLARLALTLPPAALDAGDALALMSSNALTIGRAALAVVDLDSCCRPRPWYRASPSWPGTAPPRRCTPRRPGRSPVRSGWRGRCAGWAPTPGRPPGCRTSTGCGPRRRPSGSPSTPPTTLREVVTALAAAGLENPLVLVGSRPVGGAPRRLPCRAPDGRAGRASLGLARAAVGSINRLALLTDRRSPMAASIGRRRWIGAGPRLFLAGGPPTASGIMVLEYTAAAALGTVRAAAGPAATADRRPLARGIEQDATYAPLAADQLAEAIAAARVLVAVELVAAVRALRLRGFAVPAEPLRRSGGSAQGCPPAWQDRDLTEDVDSPSDCCEIAPSGERAAGVRCGRLSCPWRCRTRPGRRRWTVSDLREDEPRDRAGNVIPRHRPPAGRAA